MEIKPRFICTHLQMRSWILQTASSMGVPASLRDAALCKPALRLAISRLPFRACQLQQASVVHTASVHDTIAHGSVKTG